MSRTEAPEGGPWRRAARRVAGLTGWRRAALAVALGIDANPDASLCFSVDNLSITRIDHIPGPGAGGNWKIVSVNQSPT